MFVIVTNRVRNRIRQCLVILVFTLAITLIFLQLLRVFGGLTFFHGQMQEDHPSGNPMRVEADNQPVKPTERGYDFFNKFVVKFKDIYSEAGE